MESSYEGALGGTLIMWKDSIFSGTLIDANKHFNVAKIHNLSQGNYWYVVNIYASNNKNARKKFQDSLSKLKSLDYNGKWVMSGDCNVPLYEHEKKEEIQVNWKEDWILRISLIKKD